MTESEHSSNEHTLQNAHAYSLMPVWFLTLLSVVHIRLCICVMSERRHRLGTRLYNASCFTYWHVTTCREKPNELLLDHSAHFTAGSTQCLVVKF